MNRRNFLVGSVVTIFANSLLSEKEVANASDKHTKPKEKIHVRYHSLIKVHMTKYDKNVLIETIWGETRGESDIGKMAVVHLILNRHFANENPIFKNQKTISQVCLKKYQFSCWLKKITMRHIKRDDTYKNIIHVVEKAIHLYEKGIDYSNGALFYYSTIIDSPTWTKKMTKVNEIGKHKFYV